METIVLTRATTMGINHQTTITIKTTTTVANHARLASTATTTSHSKVATTITAALESLQTTSHSEELSHLEVASQVMAQIFSAVLQTSLAIHSLEVPQHSFHLVAMLLELVLVTGMDTTTE